MNYSPGCYSISQLFVLKQVDIVFDMTSIHHWCLRSAPRVEQFDRIRVP